MMMMQDDQQHVQQQQHHDHHDHHQESTGETNSHADKGTAGRKGRTRKAKGGIVKDGEAAAANGHAAVPAPVLVSVVGADENYNGFGDDEKTANGACAELISKRLRTLRKRLTKLEGYEAQQRDALDKDQIEALARKPEVEASIKELDDIVKQVLAAEIEEVKANKEKARLVKMTENLKVATAVMEAQNQERIRMKKTVELNFALSTLLPNISLLNNPAARLSEHQYAALTDLRALIVGVFPVSDTKNVLESAEHVLSKYLDASTEEFSRGISYAQLNTIVTNLVSPPPIPKFGAVSGVGLGGVFANGIVEESVLSVTQEVEPASQEQPAVQTPVSRTISFFASHE
ncbi:hypothetical protein BC830DRAFT_213379 [Chytriomyces sp. MP71]|nr:hypothetical protein BC830DRAFT_213379 [Chytriomyces sp. MP71]